jgi:hypothetical protein
VARPAPPSDDGSPARLIAIMVGIVGILLLGSLAWSAIGALASAVGAASSALTSARAPSTLAPAVAAPPTLPIVATPTLAAARPTAASTPVVAATSTLPEVEATPTPASAGRNPWVLLPQPGPGAHIAPGTVTIEARGRGDAPITAIRLELDGAALPVSLERRSDSIWRGFASTNVVAGQHAVRAIVTDAEGRSGSYRWTFAAGP